MNDSNEPMVSNDKKFDVLYSSLVKHHATFIDSAFRVAGFLFLVMGWLLTSKNAQSSISKSISLSIITIVLLLISGLIYSTICNRIKHFSNKLYEELETLDYLPKNYYSDRLISTRTLAVFLIAIWLLIFFAISLIYSISISP